MSRSRMSRSGRSAQSWSREVQKSVVIVSVDAGKEMIARSSKSRTSRK